MLADLISVETGAAKAEKGLVARKPASMRASVFWKSIYGEGGRMYAVIILRLDDDGSGLECEDRGRLWALLDARVGAPETRRYPCVSRIQGIMSADSSCPYISNKMGDDVGNDK